MAGNDEIECMIDEYLRSLSRAERATDTWQHTIPAEIWQLQPLPHEVIPKKRPTWMRRAIRALTGRSARERF